MRFSGIDRILEVMKKTSKFKKSTFVINAINARNQLGMSAEEFAKYAKISHNTWKNIEWGKSGGHKIIKEKVAKALGKTIDELNTPQIGIVAGKITDNSDLISRIVDILPTLNEHKLRTTLTLVETLSGIAPKARITSAK